MAAYEAKGKMSQGPGFGLSALTSQPVLADISPVLATTKMKCGELNPPVETVDGTERKEALPPQFLNEEARKLVSQMSSDSQSAEAAVLPQGNEASSLPAQGNSFFGPPAAFPA